MLGGGTPDVIRLVQDCLEPQASFIVCLCCQMMRSLLASILLLLLYVPLLLTQSKENLTSLTEATNGLKKLDFYIGEKDYLSLRVALRNPPIGNLRTSARKVIISIDDKDAEEKVCMGVMCVFVRKRGRDKDRQQEGRQTGRQNL